MLKKFFSSFVSSKNETTENYLPEKSQHSNSLSQVHSANDKHLSAKSPLKALVIDTTFSSFLSRIIQSIRMQSSSMRRKSGRLDMSLLKSQKKLTYLLSIIPVMRWPMKK